MTVLPSAVQSAFAAAGDGTVTVRVVQDAGAHGFIVLTQTGVNSGKQTATGRQVQPPLAEVTVTLTDADGHTMTAQTDIDGLAAFAPSASTLTGGQYRVDVTNPKPDTFYPGFAANNQKAPTGQVFHAANHTTPATVAPITAIDLAYSNNEKLSSGTEFVDVTDGKNAYVNTSFWYPPYYCQDNATVCDATQPWTAAPPGPASGPTEQTLFSATYHLDKPVKPLATNEETGAVYGIAYDRADQRIFSAAYAKRGSPYGPGGQGAIYVTSLEGTTANGNKPSAYPLSGTTALFATVPDAGVIEHHMNDDNQDSSFFNAPGKQSLGDIDITNDGKYLFGVNMHNNTTFVYALPSGTYQGSYEVPNPCATPSEWHPMGAGVGFSSSFIGGVCSSEDSPGASTTAQMQALSAHIYTFDPAAGAFGPQVMNQSLAYDRGMATAGSSCSGAIYPGNIGRWFPWTTGFPSGPSLENPVRCSGQMAYPTPMLDDIIEETNGDLVVAFRDRFTDQTAQNAMQPSGNGVYTQQGWIVSGGDMVRGCKLASGDYVLDPNLDSSPGTLAAGSVCTNNNVAANYNGGEPNTFREYYTGDWSVAGIHQEGFYGGLALSRSEPTIISSAMDASGAVFTQGIAAAGRDGLVPQGLVKGLTANGGTVNDVAFGKGAGMADLEVLCDQAPLQIGNRVWADSNSDGVQDAGEPALAGVTVNLYDATGTLVGTTLTSVNGNYNFDDSNVVGGLSQNTEYTVKLDNPVDYESDGPLAGRTPTVANAGTDDEHDSDGVVPSGGTYPQISVTTAGAGQDNHSYDFGFNSPVSIGDYLWLDADGDGVQDEGELPVANATVKLLDADGNVVATTTSDVNGYYAFTNLRPSTDYTVLFPTTATVGGLTYTLTQPSQGDDPATDSNPNQQSGKAAVTTPASGNNSAAPGQADNPTIDAGYAPPVSIGDYLWLDADGNGVQDEGELPVANATVKLLDADGNVVATTTSDVNGYYAFTNLPPNSDYTVQFPTTVTVGGIDYALTEPGLGDDPARDSNPNQQSGKAAVTTPASGNNSAAPGEADNATIDAGYHPKPVSIGDYLWIDADRDGIQDEGELPVANATVKLLDTDGNVVATTTTDANGYYAFTGLVPNSDYTVQFPTTVTVEGQAYALTRASQGADRAMDSNADQQSGKAAVTTPKTGANSGAPGQADDPTIDAGYVPVVSIGDYLWLDANGNGVQDAGEAPVAGATVTLLDAGGAEVGTTTTDAAGYYAFSGLVPNADYTVQFPTAMTVDGIDYALTAQGQGSDPVKDSNPNPATGKAAVTTPSSGLNRSAPGEADDPTIDAGYAPKPVSIGDYLWLDVNANGVQDDGEAPVSGAIVTLLNAGGVVVATTTTDADGYYAFTDLVPNSDYTVQFPTVVTVDGIDYALTAPGQGDDRAADSNPAQATGKAPVTTPKTGSNLGTPGNADNATIDAGYVPKPVSIGDYLWLDANGNGVQDDGEAPVSGAIVTLLDAGGVVVATTTTDADGYYAFTDLVPNSDYTVQFPTVVTVDGIDYALTAPGQGDDRAADSNPNPATGKAAVTTPKTGNNSGTPGEADDPTIDAGYHPKPVSIGDYLWLDTNGNGIQDAGEKPVPNATVTLLDAHGTVVATTKTDKNGYYAFTDLAPNTDYVVQFPTTVTVDGAKYALTKPGQGKDGAKDSNPNQATGKAAVTTPKTGNNSGAPGSADNPTIDAGYVPLVSVGDYLWLDGNGNGVQDAGEKPVPNATVTLLDANGKVVASTKTDKNGYYAFTDLLPNTKYLVQFPTAVTVDGTTYSLTKPGQGSDRATDSNPDGQTGLAEILTPAFGSNSAAPGQQDIPHIDAGYTPPPAAPLAITGVDPAGNLLAALLLLVGGGLLLLVGRRRRQI